MDWLLKLFTEPGILSFLAQFAASTALSEGFDALKNCFTKKSNKWCFLDCLQKALRATADKFYWEHDPNAIAETIICEADKIPDITFESLAVILRNAVGHQITPTEAEFFADQFIACAGQHDAFANYLMLRNIFPTATQNTAPTPTDPYCLTSAEVWFNPGILGRDALVDELCTALCTPSLPHLQIYSMGGIGKTAVLNMVYARFANQQGDERCFDHIARLDYEGNMNTDLIRSLNRADVKDADSAWRYLRNLCANKRVLLVIDDTRHEQSRVWASVTEDKSFQNLKTLTAAVLFSSRVPLDEFTQMELTPLSTEDCISIFQTQRLGENVSHDLSDKDKAILKRIIKNRAGHNTKIVQRLGAMAKSYSWSIQRLSEKLEEKDFRICTGLNETELQEQLNKLYELGQIKNPVQRSLLEAFALFPHIPLPVETCCQWLCKDAAIDDDDDCSLHLNELANTTWLERHYDESDAVSFSMHQLVSSAVRNQSDISTGEHLGLIAACAEDIYVEKTETFHNATPFIPFAESIARFWDGIQEVPLATLMHQLGGYAYETANYADALEWCQKALAIREKVLGTEHPDTAASYNNIGSVYYSMGEYDKALEFLLKALAIKEKVLGTEHPDTAASYNNIGGVYDSKGEYDKALDFSLKDLSICEKVLGSEHPATATSYNNIGIVYHRKGDYDKALEFYLKALAIREKVLGAEHPDTTTSYNNIGGVYDSMGEYDKALKFHRKALAIREKVLGTEHPDTAASYNGIGSVYGNMGEYDKALEFFLKALPIYEKVLGTEHPDTATSYNNIGGVYDSMGEHNKALEFYLKDLAICEKILGTEHPSTATSYNNIGFVYDSKGDYDKALEFYMKALAIVEKVLGMEHPNTATAYNNIASVYDSKGDYDKALEFYMKALAISEKILGTKHPDTAASYNNIGLVYDSIGEYDKALEYSLKAYRSMIPILGGQHPNTIVVKKNIESVYAKTNNPMPFPEWLKQNLQAPDDAES